MSADVATAFQPQRPVVRSHIDDAPRATVVPSANGRPRAASKARAKRPARRTSAGTTESARNDAMPPPATRSTAFVKTR
jgi:hypothetical protein